MYQIGLEKFMNTIDSLGPKVHNFSIQGTFRVHILFYPELCEQGKTLRLYLQLSLKEESF